LFISLFIFDVFEIRVSKSRQQQNAEQERTSTQYFTVQNVENWKRELMNGDKFQMQDKSALTQELEGTNW